MLVRPNTLLGSTMLSGRAFGRGATLAYDFTKNQYSHLGVNYGDFSLIPGVSISRSSVGYAERQDGTLVQFSANTARITDKGLLVEESRTNVCLRSQEFDNSFWNKTDVTVSADNAAAPDGTTTADLITEGTAGNAFTAGTSGTVAAGSTVTGTIYVKRSAVVQWVRVRVSNAAATNGTNGYFDVLNGVAGSVVTFGTATNASLSIQAVALGWYRLRVTVTLDAADTAGLLGIVSATTNGNTTRVSSSAYWLWGAQVEVGSFPTSYIPTAGSTATRGADLPVLTTNVNSALMTMIVRARFTSSSVSTGNCRMAVLSDGTTNNRWATQRNNNDLLAQAAVVGGANTHLRSTADKSGERVASQGISYDGSTYRGAVDGVAVTPTASASASGTLTRLDFGHQLGGEYLNGYVERVLIFPTAMNDVQLQAMTL